MRHRNLVDLYKFELFMQSKFDWKFQMQHIREAHLWVIECKTTGKRALDACGERGDLFFCLQSNTWLLQL